MKNIKELSLFLAANCLFLAVVTLPMSAMANVPVSVLLPVMKIDSHDQIIVKDKQGNRYLVTTNCNLRNEDIDRFQITGRRLREGTRIRINETKTCRVTQLDT